MDEASLAALRLDLTNQGVRLGDDLLAAGFGLDLATDGRAGGAEGIDLLLPGHLWTNVCVAPGYARTSPWTLACVDCSQAPDGAPPRVVLRHRVRGDIPVMLPDTARFRHARTRSGFSCGEIGAIHGNWLVVAPIAANAGFGVDRPRRFLGLPPQRPLTKSRWSIDEVVTCAEAAWNHGGARLVHLEAGHLLTDDGALTELAPYVEAIKRAVPAVISVSTLPPVEPQPILDLYAAGCDALAYHLLAWDPEAAARVAPVRARFVPHERLLAGLRAAARFLPRGAVSTDLLVGLEPLANLERALDALTAEGIVPNLAVFRPLPGAEDEAPTGDMVATEPLLALMDRRSRLLTDRKLVRSRVRGFPRVLAGLAPYQPSSLDRWYSGLRRWLRVQREEAS